MTDHGIAPVHELEEPKIEALVEVMFLAAWADEELSDTERKHLATSVESLVDRRLGSDRLEAMFHDFAAVLEKEGRAARLTHVRDALGDAKARKVALALAIQVMAADGIIRTSEREMILDMADALEVDRDVAANLVSQLGG